MEAKALFASKHPDTEKGADAKSNFVQALERSSLLNIMPQDIAEKSREYLKRFLFILDMACVFDLRQKALSLADAAVAHLNDPFVAT